MAPLGRRIFLRLQLWWQSGLVGNVVGRINEVNQRRARLVVGWVTVGRWVNHFGM